MLGFWCTKCWRNKIRRAKDRYCDACRDPDAADESTWETLPRYPDRPEQIDWEILAKIRAAKSRHGVGATVRLPRICRVARVARVR